MSLASNDGVVFFSWHFFLLSFQFNWPWVDSYQITYVLFGAIYNIPTLLCSNVQYICQNKPIFEWINNYSVKRPKSWIFGLWHMYGIIIPRYMCIIMSSMKQTILPLRQKAFSWSWRSNRSLHINEKNFRDYREVYTKVQQIVCLIHYRGRDHKKLQVKEITSNEPCIIKLTS